MARVRRVPLAALDVMASTPGVVPYFDISFQHASEPLLPGVLWAGTRAYRWVARNRFNLVPCANNACAVPLAKK